MDNIKFDENTLKEMKYYPPKISQPTNLQHIQSNALSTPSTISTTSHITPLTNHLMTDDNPENLNVSTSTSLNDSIDLTSQTKVENLSLNNNFAELSKITPTQQLFRSSHNSEMNNLIEPKKIMIPPKRKFIENNNNNITLNNKTSENQSRKIYSQGLIEDEYDIVGRNVATKLRNMSPRQKVFAEKLISDILYHGQLEQLGLTSSILTCEDDDNGVDYYDRNDSDDDPLCYMDIATDADSTKCE